MSVDFDVTRRLGPFTYEAAFTAREDEIVVLFGHSGAGKSLTLQFISGLMKPDRGRITVAGQVVFDSVAGVNLPPQRRRTGYVVQELALFEHLSVSENVAFGIPSGRDKRARVRELLALLDLEGFEGRRPRTLSGGQRQRVVLARALAREAPLLLLDEPFSALDDALRNSMRRELLRLRDELGLTILFVTHDLREAHFLADRVAVFDAGRILQFGSRDDVFRRPASRRVGELTGVANIWRGRALSAGEGFLTVDVEGAMLRVPASDGVGAGDAVDVFVRAERVNLRRDRARELDRGNQFPARVVEEYAYGASHVLRLECEGRGPALEVEIAARPYEVLGVATRRAFLVEIDPADIHAVRADA